MKNKYIIIGISVVGIVIVSSIWLYLRPEALGNINQTYKKPETSISNIEFLGEVGDKIRFSFTSNIKNGDLDIIIYDSKGNAVKQLDKADRLEVLWDLEYSDTYTLAAKRSDFVGDFKVAAYKEGSIPRSCRIL